MRRLLFLVVISSVIFSCAEQIKTKPYYFKQLDWKIDVPGDFTVLDSIQITALNKKGADAIGKTYDTTIAFTETETLISIKKGALNSFTATITPFDLKVDGSWLASNEAVKGLLMETFSSQMPDVKVDSSSTVDLVAGLPFQVFSAKVLYPNKILLYSILYSRLQNGYDLGVSITYTDEQIGKRLKDILHNSRFGK